VRSDGGGIDGEKWVKISKFDLHVMTCPGNNKIQLGRSTCLDIQSLYGFQC
jgi:hypothetical protein